MKIQLESMIFLNELITLDCPELEILELKFRQIDKEISPSHIVWNLISYNSPFTISIIYLEKHEAPGNMKFSVLIHNKESKKNQSISLRNYVNKKFDVNSNLLDIRNLNGTTEERFNIFLSKMQELLSKPDLVGFFRGEEIDPEYYMDVWKLVDK